MEGGGEGRQNKIQRIGGKEERRLYRMKQGYTKERRRYIRK